jgi:hypothetical protein
MVQIIGAIGIGVAVRGSGARWLQRRRRRRIRCRQPLRRYIDVNRSVSYGIDLFISSRGVIQYMW